MIDSRSFIVNKDNDDLPILLNKLPYRQSYPLIDLDIPNDVSCDSLSWFNRMYDNEMCTELLLPQINMLNQISKDRSDSDIEILSIELPIDPIDNITFTCPTCNRTFKGNYQACKKHLEARKHGYRCHYDINHKQLPNCLQDYSIYPYDPHSGWCDLQGRRKYIEDYHSIVFDEDYLFIGVFDGHYGSRGARLASRRIPKLFDTYIKNFEHKHHSNYFVNYNYSKQIDILDSINNDTDWRSFVQTINENTVIDSNRSLTSDMIIQSIYQSFNKVDSHLDEYSISGDVSGTTASIVIVYSEYLLIAHVGDSRIVLCCDNIGLPIVLTVDHTPYDHNEYHDIIRRGGYIDYHFGEILRVNKKLAITRSLGDKQFQDVISNIPDVLLLRKLRSINSSYIINDSYCQKYKRHYQIYEPQFVILATDGLWDVLSNEEAVEMVCEYMFNNVNDKSLDIMKNAAKILALEAYVRGSSDNIGVCIVDLLDNRNTAYS
uniref:PPM-type phosphatase domain-containing protein n=1 Tax=Chromulina nebulosa TaxID=96789 RepID=A0A7S0XDR9_9STRA|mmetsp:Transcript_3506/g.3107  ORF Transcript_3506/g.3107 Transcript_3506/m.3107 type:complete len:489 (+) Transcript_3506:1-1467(+)